MPTLTITATAPGTLSLAFTGAPTAGDYWEFQASAPQSAGVNFVQDFRQVLTGGSTITSPQAIGSVYQAVWGDLVAGRRVWIRGRYVTKGQYAGPWQYQSQTIS